MLQGTVGGQGPIATVHHHLEQERGLEPHMNEEFGLEPGCLRVDGLGWIEGEVPVLVRGVGIREEPGGSHAIDVVVSECGHEFLLLLGGKGGRR